MNTIDVTMTGTATQLITDPVTGFITDGQQSPFTLSILVDGSTPINPVLYQAFIPMSVTLNVAGQIYTANQGEFWGNHICNCPAFEAGFVISGPGLSFSWDDGETPAPTATTLKGVLLQETMSGGLVGFSAQNVHFGGSQITLSVTDIGASVPEPGMIGLFSLAVVALICARRGRRRKLSLQP